MASHGVGSRVQVRLYMEGRYIENGLTSVMTIGNTGQPATAQLELVPTNTIKHILPGTWVHVFVTDPWNPDPKGNLEDFVLLFEGVVVARGMTRQDDGRSFVVQCADPSVHWVEARQFWLNIASSGGNIIDQIVTQTTGGYGRFTTLTSNPVYGYVNEEITKSMKEGEDTFIDTMVAVLDDIGTVNPFYYNARNRFRITDRILRGPAGNTSKLFQAALLGDFLQGLAGRVSGQSNLAEVVNTMLSAIMHEWVSIVAPPYVKAEIFDRDVFGNLKRESNTVKRPAGKYRGQSRKVTLYRYRMAEDSIVASAVFKPHVYTLSPPSCNVLFPNMYDQFSYQENFISETTRLQMKPQIIGVDNKYTQGLFFVRPTELEVFQHLTRDAKTKVRSSRSPDGTYADGISQTPTFNDYDWCTNEERIRGITYNFINLAPAPSTITLSNQGERQSQGTRKGGIPQYLQNVASYEYYKSKFVARQTAISGPLNLRPVPGFPVVVLDDSQANLNMVAYLDSITHSISADGTASTSYGLRYPRLVDEVDFNRPRYKAQSALTQLDFDLFRNEDGDYEFEQMFDGVNRPPIPEWFDEMYKEVWYLDQQYQAWFGPNVHVVERELMTEPTGTDAEQSATIEENNQIDLVDTVKALNSKYATARAAGREFVETAEYTSRSFTKIDEAFKFVGAAPVEAATKAVTKYGTVVPSEFGSVEARDRAIDYDNDRLETFVGDTTAGSGYSGVPLGDKTSSGAEKGAQSSSSDEAVNRMSGAFPEFDLTIHKGDQATDQTTRNQLLNDPENRKKSAWARYDGRPFMHDFEYRIWQKSVAEAGLAPDDESISTAAESAKYRSLTGGTTRETTGEEESQAAIDRQATLAENSKEATTQTSEGNPPPGAKKKNMSPAEQAPTGDSAEGNAKQPLPQPLSEKQVIDLRRAVVDAYREELARTRGFTG